MTKLYEGRLVPVVWSVMVGDEFAGSLYLRPDDVYEATSVARNAEMRCFKNQQDAKTWIRNRWYGIDADASRRRRNLS